MKVKDILIALLLSLTLTFGAGFLYVFYPIIAAIFRTRFENAGTGGVVVVAGGVSNIFLLALFMIEPFVFLVIFAWLRAKHAAR